MRAGLAIRPTRQLLFFHPRYMQRLLQADSRALLEVPLKIIVMADASDRVILRGTELRDAFSRYPGMRQLAEDLATLCQEIVAVVAPMANDVGGYLAGLTMFRLGQRQPWITWFAGAISGASRAQTTLVNRVEKLREEWQSRLASPEVGRAPRRDSAAWRVLGLMPRHLVLTTDLVARELGNTRRAAHDTLRTLVAAGVVTEHLSPTTGTRGRPNRVYISHDLLDLATIGRT